MSNPLHLPDPATWSRDYDRLIDLMEQGKRVVTVHDQKIGEHTVSIVGQAFGCDYGYADVTGAYVHLNQVTDRCKRHNLRFLDDADKVQTCTDEDADKGLRELFIQGASREDCMHFLKNRNFSEAKIYALLKPYFPF